MLIDCFIILGSKYSISPAKPIRMPMIIRILDKEIKYRFNMFV